MVPLIIISIILLFILDLLVLPVLILANINRLEERIDSIEEHIEETIDCHIVKPPTAIYEPAGPGVFKIKEV